MERTRSNRVGYAWLAGAWVVAAALIGVSRAPAAETHHRVKETSDVYVLPSPGIVKALSLGHHAAVVDHLWAMLLVDQGLHTIEKRRYENMFFLVDTINELEPTFREPYLVIEALTMFQVNGVPEDDVRRARVVVERGVRNMPNDPEVLLAAGSFIGLMAPSSYLSDPAEQRAWTEDGAKYLQRAAELGDDRNYVGWHALSGFSLLRRAGKDREAVRFLQNQLATTDDDELREHLKTMLANMMKRADAFEKSEESKAAMAAHRRQDRFNEIWRTEYPLASKTAARVLGPPYDAAYCAGGAHASDERCAFDWAGWAARVEARASEASAP